MKLRNSLDGVVSFLLSETCANVAVLSGAGVSVAAGIPDFRSPTGMYATLPVEQITASRADLRLIRADPTYVVEKGMFMRNPLPYLEVRRPFILGTSEAKWKMTAAHRLFEALDARGKLVRLYTQNIDGLDLQTAIPPDKIIGVHGTLGRAACEACGHECDFGEFAAAVRGSVKDIYNVDLTAPPHSTPIACSACGLPAVKPMTVLFGGELPARFFECARRDMPRIDLLIVAGTSLVVSPANGLVRMCDCPRVIINNQPVGEELGIQYGAPADALVRDVFLGGDCEDVCTQLLRGLGTGGGGEPSG
jgi:NAD-dependent SIR2 family protein deacetylase